MDGIPLRRNWGGEFENVAILVAIAVNEDGYREVLGAAEGVKEDKTSWVSFLQWLRIRGLDGVKLIVGDKYLGMLKAVGEMSPKAKYQRCTVHFYRNVFFVTPRSKVKLVAIGWVLAALPLRPIAFPLRGRCSRRSTPRRIRKQPKLWWRNCTP